MGNYHKVDKGEFFIEEGMTLITEVDSDKYLDMAEADAVRFDDFVPRDRLSGAFGGLKSSKSVLNN